MPITRQCHCIAPTYVDEGYFFVQKLFIHNFPCFKAGKEVKSMTRIFIKWFCSGVIFNKNTNFWNYMRLFFSQIT